MGREVRVWVDVLAAATLLVTGDTRAVDKSECVAAYEQAQVLRDAAKLRGAREQLLLCAQPACPAFIQSDCTHWLKDVENNLPTIVISARDQNGREITTVRVRQDGAPLLEALDGKAIAVDPGPHSFRFERGTDAPVEQRYVIHQGEHNRPILVQLGPKVLPSAPVDVETGGSPTWAWVAGSLGAVGIGGFAYFGLTGHSEIERLRSQCAPSCNQSDVDSARRKLFVADASLGIGVVSLAVATYLFLSKDSGHATQARVNLQPIFDQGSTELAVRF
jgi:hypothetical protein